MRLVVAVLLAACTAKAAIPPAPIEPPPATIEPAPATPPPAAPPTPPPTPPVPDPPPAPDPPPVAEPKPTIAECPQFVAKLWAAVPDIVGKESKADGIRECRAQPPDEALMICVRVAKTNADVRACVVGR